MQEKKGGIPGRKRFGKGKDCYGQKDHSRQWQKQKREKIYDIWKVH